MVGQEEVESRSVNVRIRDDAETKGRGKLYPLDEVVEKLVALKATRQLENTL